MQKLSKKNKAFSVFTHRSKIVLGTQSDFIKKTVLDCICKEADAYDYKEEGLSLPIIGFLNPNLYHLRLVGMDLNDAPEADRLKEVEKKYSKKGKHVVAVITHKPKELEATVTLPLVSFLNYLEGYLKSNS